MDKLTVDQLALSYGGHSILQDVSFEMKAGEVVCLLGASGCGKTTLLRAIAGLEQPLSGRIQLDDQVFFDGRQNIQLPVEQRALGLVFQSYALWPHRTVFDNVGYGLKLRRVRSAEMKQRVQSVLDQLGLGHLAARYPYQLSGGQQQRVAIARALVYNPPVILMDEPLSNLDARLREEARVWLRELIISLGLSAVIVTHDQTEAMTMCDRIVLLNNGRIEQEGTPTEMYGAPRTLYTAEFMGSNNQLHARVTHVEGARVALSGDGWQLHGIACGAPISAEQNVQAMIRVERVRLADGPGENRLQARLITAMYLGDRWEYLFHCGKLHFRAFGRDTRAPGNYWVEFPVNDCWVFAAGAA